MSDEQPQPNAPESGQATGGGLPWGLMIGIALGLFIGFIRGDMTTGAGLAVAFGISFWFLSPLVRNFLNKQNSDNPGANTPENGD